MDIKRKFAADLIQEVRLACAVASEGKSGESAEQLADKIQRIMNHYGVGPYYRCIGEAHTNANIDNCGACLGGTWGWTGEKVRIR